METPLIFWLDLEYFVYDERRIEIWYTLSFNRVEELDNHIHFARLWKTTEMSASLFGKVGFINSWSPRAEIEAVGAIILGVGDIIF